MSSLLAWGFPGGKLVYSGMQTKAMTTGADTQTIICPANKRWLIYWLMMTNDSGQNVDCKIYIRSPAGAAIIGILHSATINDGAYVNYPCQEGTLAVTMLGHGLWPIMIENLQEIYLSWGALAGKAGNSSYFAQILELDI